MKKRNLKALFALTASLLAMTASPAAKGNPVQVSDTKATQAAHEAQAEPARGVWVWKTEQFLGDGASLARACRDMGANEVYLAVTHAWLADPRLPSLVKALQHAGLRVEALMGDPSWSTAEEQPAMLRLIDHVAAFGRHTGARFAAVHMDVEPHVLAENRNADVGQYLPGYVESMRVARARAERRGLAFGADVPRHFFRADGIARKNLVEAIPRLFLMLYELPEHGKDTSDAARELERASADVIQSAYAEASAQAGSEMVVGLSVEDYGRRLPTMLDAVDTANRKTGHYGGWAIHDFSQYASEYGQSVKG